MKLEEILCSPDGFGLESATFGQRAICRLIDGTPLDDLLARGTNAERSQVERYIGCPASQLPPGQPLEVVDLEPVRCGKTLRNVANAVRWARTVDVSMVRPGQEPPRISILSTGVDTARVFRGHLQLVRESSLLRQLVVGETSDSMVIQHPSGLPIEIRVVAAHRGGYSLASRWSAGVSFEEAPGWYSTDKVVSLEENRETVLGRLLPGAQAIYSGSPWQPSGFCFDQYQENHGKPTTDLLVIKAGPAWELNPQYFTPERVAQLKRTSPNTFRMHVLAEFGGVSGVFDPEAVERAMRALPAGSSCCDCVGLLDMASGGGDSLTHGVAGYVIPAAPDKWLMKPRYVERDERPKGNGVTPRKAGTLIGHFPVWDDQGNQVRNPAANEPRPPVLVLHALGGFGGAFYGKVSAAEMFAGIAATFRRFGVREVYGDQREALMVRSEFARHGLNFTQLPWTNERKAEAVRRVRRLLSDSTLVLPQSPELTREMANYVQSVTAGGLFKYGARGSGHDDRVALLMTLAMAEHDFGLPGSDLNEHRRSVKIIDTNRG